MWSEQRPAQRLGGAWSANYDIENESGEDHKDRLFVLVLMCLAVNVMALLILFTFLLPTTAQGREIGGALFAIVLGTVVGIRLLFAYYGNRHLCVNLLLAGLWITLFSASFVLGGIISPTMIFMLSLPVLAATMMNSRWAFSWTAATILGWLSMVAVTFSGADVQNLTATGNVGVVQVIALMGTLLIVMGVLASYVRSDQRLRSRMASSHERLDYLASHDPLTGLVNRRAFMEEAQRALQRARREERPLALLIIDLHDFKNLNDNLGHALGDAVLANFAQRLRAGFRETDTVGRLGGDEFAVILASMDEAEDIDKAIERLMAVETQPLLADDKPVQYSWDIGSALYPVQAHEFLDLYEIADRHMYAAKERQRSRRQSEQQRPPIPR